MARGLELDLLLALRSGEVRLLDVGDLDNGIVRAPVLKRGRLEDQSIDDRKRKAWASLERSDVMAWRWIPADERIAELWRELAGDGDPDRPLLFSKRRPDGRIHRNTLNDGFRRAARYAGIDRHHGLHPTSHALRHTHASAVAEATNDPYAVKEALGHLDLASGIAYVHSSWEARQRAAVAARTLLRPGSNHPGAATAPPATATAG